MHWTALLGSAIDQTTSPSTVFRIAFQNLTIDQSFQHFSEVDTFLNHLLLCMLCDAQVLGSSLGANPLKNEAAA
jgi:hypothetical protein